MLEAGSGPVIAVLGAESTGKTLLAEAVAAALRAEGRAVAVVAEYLREFCDRAGRTPRRDEQAGIAAEQWRRIAAAARNGCTVLADTTPLMTSVYSEYVFGDQSLHTDALALQRQCRHTLLTGLDIAWQPDGLQRDGPHVRATIDTMVRNALATAGLAHSVVYGMGPARCGAALAALRPVLRLQPPVDTDAAHDRPLRLRGRCRECLVPGCEHLLLPKPAA